jgi:hypothetical protein
MCYQPTGDKCTLMITYNLQNKFVNEDTLSRLSTFGIFRIVVLFHPSGIEILFTAHLLDHLLTCRSQFIFRKNSVQTIRSRAFKSPIENRAFLTS